MNVKFNNSNLMDWFPCLMACQLLHINLWGLSNAKDILVEEQMWYNLTNN